MKKLAKLNTNKNNIFNNIMANILKFNVTNTNSNLKIYYKRNDSNAPYIHNVDTDNYNDNYTSNINTFIQNILISTSNFVPDIENQTDLREIILTTSIPAIGYYQLFNSNGTCNASIQPHDHFMPAYSNNSNIGIILSKQLFIKDDITAFSTQNPSDIKLKSDIISIQNSLNIIDQLNPVIFNWNKEAKKIFPNIKNIKDIGFIAQDVEKISDLLVQNNFINGNEFKTISYNKLIPFIVDSIKELKSRLEKLENKCKFI